MFLDFLDRRIIDEGTLLNSWLEAVAHLKFPDRGDELLSKRVVNASLHVQPVRTDAGLASIAVFGNDGSFNGGIEIGIIKDDEGCIAAELQGKLLYRGRSSAS